jgi:hypothetical protein
MQPVALPTRVDDLHWPVLSAVRVSAADAPDEFVVVADCAKPPPRERYAMLRGFRAAGPHPPRVHDF